MTLFLFHIPELPECPQGLAVADRSGRSVTLQWTRGFDGNAEVHAYRLQIRAIGDTRTRLTPDWADAPTRDITASSVDIFERFVAKLLLFSVLKILYEYLPQKNDLFSMKIIQFKDF